MAKKTVPDKSVKRVAKKAVATDDQNSQMFRTGSTHAFSNLLSPRNRFRIAAVIILVLVLIGALLYRNKQLFIVAMVNGQPILRSDLNDQLIKNYGKQTLDNMLNERLVTNEVKKQNIIVSDTEIQNRIDELTKTLPQGMKINDALAAQGISEEQFRTQLKLQLAVDKLLDQEVSVSASEVDAFIKQNKQSLPASGEAELKRQVEVDLRRQKVEELFQGWFAGLKEKASIQRFL